MITISVLSVLFSVINCFNAAFGVYKIEQVIPENYDKSEPPWTKEEPTDDYIQLTIMEIDEINDGKMEFSLQCYIFDYWRDRRLNLTSFMGENAMQSIMPNHIQNEIWMPDIIFENVREGKVFQFSLPNSFVKVTHGGDLLRAVRYSFTVGCQMDFHFYPIDTQKCFLKISTLGNADKKVLLHWMEEHPQIEDESIVVMYDLYPLNYKFKKPETYKSTEYWSVGNYTYLYANFTFDRRFTGSLFNVYVPSTLVVFLSWISMWLEVEAVPARITLGVTSLLTLATQVHQAHVGLPPISYMTAVDIWLFACIMTVFASLLEFAFAYQSFILNKQRVVEEDRWDRVHVSMQNSEKVFRSSRRRRDFNSRPYSGTSSEEIRKLANGGKTLDKLCRKLFPLAFIIFCIVYWSYYLSQTM